MSVVASSDIHSAAVHRHAIWARDFAAAGDLEAAMEALIDLRALAAEQEEVRAAGADV